MNTENTLPEFKAFREIEKIARVHAPFTTETKIVEEKRSGDKMEVYLESILWRHPVNSAEAGKKQWQSSIKVSHGPYETGASFEIEHMHGKQRRSESFYLGKTEVDMLIKFLQSLDLADYSGEWVPTKLEKY